MLNTKPNREHNYKLRSCLNCDRFDDCDAKTMHLSASTHGDFGKYGCTHYKGIYQNEIDKKKK